MVSARAARMKSTIGRDGFPATDVGDDRLFVWNYHVREPDVEDWHVVSTRRACLPTGICVGRTTWQRPGGSADELLLIESYECPRREVAHDTLLELLATFQIPRDFEPDVDAPAGLQLVDADGTNALVAVGNLVLRVSSGGSVPIPARLVSRQVVGRVAARPTARPPGATNAARPVPMRRRKRLAVGDSTPIEPGQKLCERGVDAAEPGRYLKLFTRGGHIRAEDDKLTFVAEDPGDAVIDYYSLASDDDTDTERVRVDLTVHEP
jgi:hypothetical protein